MIQELKNQQIVFNKNRTCHVCDEICFCQKFANEDGFYWQGKQTSCFENQVCDPNFSNILGDDLVLNGSFFADASGWTLLNEVTYDASNQCVKFDDTDGVGQTTLKQNVAGITPGKKYLVKLTIKNYIQGAVQLYLLDSSPTTVITLPLNQEYSFVVTAVTDLVQVFGSVSFGLYPQFSIDDISVQEINEDCWSYDNSWGVLNGSACHIPGSTTPLINLNTVVFANTYYKVVVKISGSTTGGISINGLNGTGASFSGNGTFTGYFITGNTGNFLEMIPDTDFDGCITNLQFYPLRKDYIAKAIDSTTGDVVKNFTLNYYQEWVTIAEILNKTGVDVGCYNLAVIDPCKQDLSKEAIGDTGFDDAGDWTVSSGAGSGTGAITGSAFKVTSSGSVIETKTAITSYNWAQQDMIVYANIRFKTGAWDNADPLDRIFIITPNGGTPTITELTITTIEQDKQYNFSIPITIHNTGAIANKIGIGIKLNNSSNAEIFEIKDFSFEIIAEYEADPGDCLTICPIEFDYTSNCFCFAEEWPCLPMLQGYSDNEAFGFEYLNTGFRLQERLMIAINSPEYPESSDDYPYSNGVRELNFSQSEKFSVLFIERVPELVHDVVRLMKASKHFFVEEEDGTMVEWFPKPGTYQPEWPKRGRKADAHSQFEMCEKGQTLYMTNCK